MSEAKISDRKPTTGPSLPRRVGFVFATLGLSGLLGLVAVDLGLRLSWDARSFLPYHRNAVRVFYPSDEVTPGVTGPSSFTTNSLGTRGPEPAREPVRILTIGGSTTACTVLDDRETWPHLLMQYLNVAVGSGTVWVTNSAIDGHNSHHHLMHARYLVPLVPDLDFVLLYAGLNDVGMWLYHEDYDPSFLDDPDNYAHRLGEAFRVSRYTPANWPWYKHSAIWKRLSTVRSWIRTRRAANDWEAGIIVQDAELRWLQEWQAQRSEREKAFVHVAKMETLPAALASYARNLRGIAEAVREAGAAPIFMAQAIQSQILTEEERERLWMGAMDGGKTYVRKEQMLELLEAHNVVMHDVAVELGVRFVDLPALLEGERGLFYDGAHLNERGARVVARSVAKELVDTVLAESGRAKSDEPARGGAARASSGTP